MLWMCSGKRYPPAESSRSWFQGTALEEFTDYLRMSSKQLETILAHAHTHTHTASTPPAAIAPPVCTVSPNALTRQGDCPCPGSRPLRRQSSSRGRFRRSSGGVGSQDLHDKRPFLTRFLMSMGQKRSRACSTPHVLHWRLCNFRSSLRFQRASQRCPCPTPRSGGAQGSQSLQRTPWPLLANPPPRTRGGAWWPGIACTSGPPGLR